MSLNGEVDDARPDPRIDSNVVARVDALRGGERTVAGQHLVDQAAELPVVSQTSHWQVEEELGGLEGRGRSRLVIPELYCVTKL